MCAADVESVLKLLRRLQDQPQWEVRHGSLLVTDLLLCDRTLRVSCRVCTLTSQGVKYLVAVRADLSESLLPLLLPICVRGLDDSDDDVRAAAAEALLPITDAVSTSSEEVGTNLFLFLIYFLKKDAYLNNFACRW
jgi:TATA-binding protein-associated factor